jgi:hypothetical protein
LSEDLEIRSWWTASVVLLIRHDVPEPPVPGNSGAKDDERPLTSEGLLAAERLAERMRAEPITAVFSSPYRRALETGRESNVRISPLTRKRERKSHFDEGVGFGTRRKRHHRVLAMIQGRLIGLMTRRDG